MNNHNSFHDVFNFNKEHEGSLLKDFLFVKSLDKTKVIITTIGIHEDMQNKHNTHEKLPNIDSNFPGLFSSDIELSNLEDIQNQFQIYQNKLDCSFSFLNNVFSDRREKTEKVEETKEGKNQEDEKKKFYLIAQKYSKIINDEIKSKNEAINKSNNEVQLEHFRTYKNNDCVSFSSPFFVASASSSISSLSSSLFSSDLSLSSSSFFFPLSSSSPSPLSLSFYSSSSFSSSSLSLSSSHSSLSLSSSSPSFFSLSSSSPSSLSSYSSSSSSLSITLSSSPSSLSFSSSSHSSLSLSSSSPSSFSLSSSSPSSLSLSSSSPSSLSLSSSSPSSFSLSSSSPSSLSSSPSSLSITLSSSPTSFSLSSSSHSSLSFSSSSSSFILSSFSSCSSTACTSTCILPSEASSKNFLTGNSSCFSNFFSSFSSDSISSSNLSSSSLPPSFFSEVQNRKKRKHNRKKNFKQNKIEENTIKRRKSIEIDSSIEPSQVFVCIEDSTPQVSSNKIFFTLKEYTNDLITEFQNFLKLNQTENSFKIPKSLQTENLLRKIQKISGRISPEDLLLLQPFVLRMMPFFLSVFEQLSSLHLHHPEDIYLKLEEHLCIEKDKFKAQNKKKQSKIESIDCCNNEVNTNIFSKLIDGLEIVCLYLKLISFPGISTHLFNNDLVNDALLASIKFHVRNSLKTICAADLSAANNAKPLSSCFFDLSCMKIKIVKKFSEILRMIHFASCVFSFSDVLIYQIVSFCIDIFFLNVCQNIFCLLEAATDILVLLSNRRYEYRDNILNILLTKMAELNMHRNKDKESMVYQDGIYLHPISILIMRICYSVSSYNFIELEENEFCTERKRFVEYANVDYDSIGDNSRSGDSVGQSEKMFVFGLNFDDSVESEECGVSLSAKKEKGENKAEKEESKKKTDEAKKNRGKGSTALENDREEEQQNEKELLNMKRKATAVKNLIVLIVKNIVVKLLLNINLISNKNTKIFRDDSKNNSDSSTDSSVIVAHPSTNEFNKKLKSVCKLLINDFCQACSHPRWSVAPLIVNAFCIVLIKIINEGRITVCVGEEVCEHEVDICAKEHCISILGDISSHIFKHDSFTPRLCNDISTSLNPNKKNSYNSRSSKNHADSAGIAARNKGNQDQPSSPTPDSSCSDFQNASTNDSHCSPACLNMSCLKCGISKSYEEFSCKNNFGDSADVLCDECTYRQIAFSLLKQFIANENVSNRLLNSFYNNSYDRNNSSDYDNDSEYLRFKIFNEEKLLELVQSFDKTMIYSYVLISYINNLSCRYIPIHIINEAEYKNYFTNNQIPNIRSLSPSTVVSSDNPIFSRSSFICILADLFHLVDRHCKHKEDATSVEQRNELLLQDFSESRSNSHLAHCIRKKKHERKPSNKQKSRTRRKEEKDKTKQGMKHSFTVNMNQEKNNDNKLKQITKVTSAHNENSANLVKFSIDKLYKLLLIHEWNREINLTTNASPNSNTICLLDDENREDKHKDIQNLSDKVDSILNFAAEAASSKNTSTFPFIYEHSAKKIWRYFVSQTFFEKTKNFIFNSLKFVIWDNAHYSLRRASIVSFREILLADISYINKDENLSEILNACLHDKSPKVRERSLHLILQVYIYKVLLSCNSSSNPNSMTFSEDVLSTHERNSNNKLLIKSDDLISEGKAIDSSLEIQGNCEILLKNNISDVLNNKHKTLINASANANELCYDRDNNIFNESSHNINSAISRKYSENKNSLTSVQPCASRNFEKQKVKGTDKFEKKKVQKIDELIDENILHNVFRCCRDISPCVRAQAIKIVKHILVFLLINDNEDEEEEKELQREKRITEKNERHSDELNEKTSDKICSETKCNDLPEMKKHENVATKDTAEKGETEDNKQGANEVKLRVKFENGYSKLPTTKVTHNESNVNHYYFNIAANKLLERLFYQDENQSIRLLVLDALAYILFCKNIKQTKRNARKIIEIFIFSEKYLNEENLLSLILEYIKNKNFEKVDLIMKTWLTLFLDLFVIYQGKQLEEEELHALKVISLFSKNFVSQMNEYLPYFISYLKVPPRNYLQQNIVIQVASLIGIIIPHFNKKNKKILKLFRSIENDLLNFLSNTGAVLREVLKCLCFSVMFITNNFDTSIKPVLVNSLKYLLYIRHALLKNSASNNTFHSTTLSITNNLNDKTKSIHNNDKVVITVDMMNLMQRKCWIVACVTEFFNFNLVDFDFYRDVITKIKDNRIEENEKNRKGKEAKKDILCNIFEIYCDIFDLLPNGNNRAFILHALLRFLTNNTLYLKTLRVKEMLSCALVSSNFELKKSALQFLFKITKHLQNQAIKNANKIEDLPHCDFNSEEMNKKKEKAKSKKRKSSRKFEEAENETEFEEERCTEELTKINTSSSSATDIAQPLTFHLKKVMAIIYGLYNKFESIQSSNINNNNYSISNFERSDHTNYDCLCFIALHVLQQFHLVGLVNPMSLVSIFFCLIFSINKKTQIKALTFLYELMDNRKTILLNNIQESLLDSFHFIFCNFNFYLYQSNFTEKHLKLLIRLYAEKFRNVKSIRGKIIQVLCQQIERAGDVDFVMNLAKKLEKNEQSILLFIENMQNVMNSKSSKEVNKMSITLKKTLKKYRFHSSCKENEIGTCSEDDCDESVETKLNVFDINETIYAQLLYLQYLSTIVLNLPYIYETEILLCIHLLNNIFNFQIGNVFAFFEEKNKGFASNNSNLTHIEENKKSVNIKRSESYNFEKSNEIKTAIISQQQTKINKIENININNEKNNNNISLCKDISNSVQNDVDELYNYACILCMICNMIKNKLKSHYKLTDEKCYSYDPSISIKKEKVKFDYSCVDEKQTDKKDLFDLNYYVYLTFPFLLYPKRKSLPQLQVVCSSNTSSYKATGDVDDSVNNRNKSNSNSYYYDFYKNIIVHVKENLQFDKSFDFNISKNNKISTRKTITKKIIQSRIKIKKKKKQCYSLDEEESDSEKIYSSSSTDGDQD